MNQKLRYPAGYALYRYDYGGDFHNLYLEVIEYPIIRKTPQGWWISVMGQKPKWVSNNARKRFAYPTLQEAAVNFKFRKMKEIRILKRRKNFAKGALYLIEQVLQPKTVTV